MSNRRSFIKGSVAAAVLTGLAHRFQFCGCRTWHDFNTGGKPKLRFAIASDGHYGQPNTDYKKDHENIVRWLNEAHAQNPLNFVIINGDLVHDRPELLAGC